MTTGADYLYSTLHIVPDTLELISKLYAES